MKNSIEVSKNANCFIEDIPSQNSSFCVHDRLKAILDPNAIWKDDVLIYIGGSISQLLRKKVKCPVCVASLYQAADSNHISYGSSSLTNCKTYGRTICTEVTYRRFPFHIGFCVECYNFCLTTPPLWIYMQGQFCIIGAS